MNTDCPPRFLRIGIGSLHDKEIMNPVIKAENLTFSYPGDEETKPVKALRGVSFEIPEGSFTAILGHNGSG